MDLLIVFYFILYVIRFYDIIILRSFLFLKKKKIYPYNPIIASIGLNCSAIIQLLTLDFGVYIGPTYIKFDSILLMDVTCECC